MSNVTDIYLIDNGYTEDKEKAYGFTISVEEKMVIY